MGSTGSTASCSCSSFETCRFRLSLAAICDTDRKRRISSTLEFQVRKRREMDEQGWGEDQDFEEPPESKAEDWQEIAKRERLKVESAKRLGYRAVMALHGCLLGLIAVGWGGVLLSARFPVLEALLGASVMVTGAAGIWLVSRPISISTCYDTEWLVFKTYFWLIPFLVVSWLPLVGGPLGVLFGVALGVYLWRGRFGESRINSGGMSGSTSTYCAVDLEEGEGRPASLYFLGLGLLARPALLPLVDPDRVQSLLRSAGLG